MLNLNTQLRQRLFAFIFANENEEFYLRELAAQINVDAGNLSRELNVYEKEGIFISHLKGNIKLYRINKQYPLYEEYKSIVTKTLGLEYEIKSIVDFMPGIGKAIICGSYIKQKDNFNAEVKLLVSGNYDKEVLIMELNKLKQDLGREIEYNHIPAEELEEKLSAMTEEFIVVKEERELKIIQGTGLPVPL